MGLPMAADGTYKPLEACLPSNTKDELYDLQADPAELNNLIDDPEHARALRGMKGRLIGWNDETNDMFQWKWVKANSPAPIRPAGTG